MIGVIAGGAVVCAGGVYVCSATRGAMRALGYLLALVGGWLIGVGATVAILG